MSMIEKGVSDVGKTVLTIVLVSLILGSILGLAIFENIDVSGSVTNETLTNVTNITTSTFAIIGTYSNADCTLGDVHNATGGEVLTSGNYTEGTCTIILANDSAYIGEDLNVSYSWEYESTSTLSGINVSALSAIFAAFIVAITAFMVIGGTLLGILWILPYIRPLFKKDSMGISE